MNIRRGVKRITLVLSVAVGLGVWAYSSESLFDHWHWEREQYSAHKEKHENIDLFWKMYDGNGWDTGQTGTLRSLLVDGGMRFTCDGRTFTLYQNDVLPGMGTEAIYLPPEAFETAVQKARACGANRAFIDYVWAETFWTKRTRPQLLALSAIFGLLIGTGAFIAVWLLFVLGKWISHGFCADAVETNDVPVETVTPVVGQAVDERDWRGLPPEEVTTGTR